MEGSNFGVSSTIYDELMLSGKPPILKTDEIVMGGRANELSSLPPARPHQKLLSSADISEQIHSGKSVLKLILKDDGRS